MTRRKLQAVPQTAPKAVIYVRQSIKKEESISLELQETTCRDYAARLGYEVVGVIDDPNRTGTTLKRRRVQEFIDLVQRREADVVVLWRWSRLSRHRKDFAIVCDMVESFGGRVESATEPMDVTTASGRFGRGVMAEFAAYESELKGEVWKEIHQHRRSRGVPASGGPRFGYLHENGSDEYTIDPVTGPVLAEIYRRRIAGEGYRRLVIWCHEQGLRGANGHPFSTNALRFILVSGFGAGKIVISARDPKRRHWVNGKHPAVINERQWLAFQRQLLAGTRPAYSTQPKYLLSGIIKCGDCLRTMHITSQGKPTPGYGYVCGTWADNKTCRCITVSRRRAERAVLKFLHEVSDDVSAASRRAAAAQERRTVARSESADISRRLKRAEERLNRLTSGWTEGLVPDSAYLATRDEILDVQRHLTAELEAAEARVERAPKAIAVPPELLAVWDQLPVDDRRTVLRPLVDRVEVIRPAEGKSAQGRNRIVVVASWGERFDYI
jgi:site-specific DNA recombinase